MTGIYATNGWARHGLRMVGPELHFEGIRLVNLEEVPGLYPSARADLIALVNGIEGVDDPGKRIAELQEALKEGEGA
jgi:hypothetical protein